MPIGETHLPTARLVLSALLSGGQTPGPGKQLSFKKRHYIVFVSRDADGSLHKVPVPMHYAYIFMAAAVVGLFTVTGLAGSYSRMLIKTARFDQLRLERDSSRDHNAKLEQVLAEKNVQLGSLGSLAGEVSALYGLTASKLSLPGRVKAAGKKGAQSAAVAAPLNDDSYFKSVDTFYALRSTAMSGVVMRPLSSGSGTLSGFDHLQGLGMDESLSLDAPSLWPVMGPITSGFGERQDPIIGNGEGEFHRGIDIGASDGTPVRATADGMVLSAGMESGYGREITLDHGHGLKTLYGHLSGFNCMPGQQVLRGQVIGYVGHSGRVTGAHLHYEVRIRNTAVNPHKYLQVTMADLGGVSSGL